MHRLSKSVTARTRRHRSAGQSRRGVAAVEFAVCLPVLVLLVFGSIEASSFIFLKQSLNVAAYEAIRESARVSSDNVQGTDRAINILQARNVNDFTIGYPNGDSAAANRGDEIVVEVSAPTATNSPLAGQFVTNRILTARVVMVKE
ncbi:TadE/TadG family type IV pilus assembly protein [Rubripirellula reticaptiva]|uniref:TadE-like protein n=1 Tax=Rubripirellula reticaptiva TaxID=2528013 RepID=A0A5C6ESE8_9BACT|nr:TadE/TadG family type IV pilus assembly protein [Rubripirellula reticaptiva]TWU51928.1 TadE-like protein [Rubripirellula reticaptiva]